MAWESRLLKAGGEVGGGWGWHCPELSVDLVDRPQDNITPCTGRSRSPSSSPPQTTKVISTLRAQAGWDGHGMEITMGCLGGAATGGITRGSFSPVSTAFVDGPERHTRYRTSHPPYPQRRVVARGMDLLPP